MKSKKNVLVDRTRSSGNQTMRLKIRLYHAFTKRAECSVLIATNRIHYLDFFHCLLELGRVRYDRDLFNNITVVRPR